MQSVAARRDFWHLHAVRTHCLMNNASVCWLLNLKELDRFKGFCHFWLCKSCKKIPRIACYQGLGIEKASEIFTTSGWMHTRWFQGWFWVLISGCFVHIILKNVVSLLLYIESGLPWSQIIDTYDYGLDWPLK